MRAAWGRGTQIMPLMRAHNGVDPEFEATEDVLAIDATPRLGTKSRNTWKRVGFRYESKIRFENLVELLSANPRGRVVRHCRLNWHPWHPLTELLQFDRQHRDESIPLENTIVLLKDRFSFGWSHYVPLLTVDNPEECRFYEVEAAGNGWSVRDLERQIASSLNERLALSRDKEEVRRLASEGQVIEKASNLIKNPLVLEFLGLAEEPVYSVSELETAIIDRLQHFLLEVGKGFLIRGAAEVVYFRQQSSSA